MMPSRILHEYDPSAVTEVLLTGVGCFSDRLTVVHSP